MTPFFLHVSGDTLRQAALLALADGSLFWGESIGATGKTVGEVVFNTAITGYQEILTDPSYTRQIVTLTYPHIGNVGCNSDDEESGQVAAAGLVIKDLSPVVSSWRSRQPLDVYLAERNVVAISGIDTRRLTRILRAKGAQSGCIVAGANIDVNAAIAAALQFPGLIGMDLASVVTTKSVYAWREGIWQRGSGFEHYPQADATRPHVVAFDFGAKRNILRLLADRGANVTVVPAKTSAQDVLAMKPDGVFLSSGPGDPEPCGYAIDAIRELVDRSIPTFGICLGHQLLGLASGARTVKMKFGHHGANHPVVELGTGRVMITSQNHGFAVDEASLPANVKPTHRSLFDQSLQGLECTDRPAFSFQGHPEASPGPRDIEMLFDRFASLMAESRRRAQ